MAPNEPLTDRRESSNPLSEPFSELARLRPYQIWNGVIARAIHGDRLTMAVLDLEPNIAVPEHQHENEQVGFVVRGQITMDVNGKLKLLEVGHTYSIASGTKHMVTAGPDGATVVDIFAPVRSDWEHVRRLDPSPGLWP